MRIKNDSDLGRLLLDNAMINKVKRGKGKKVIGKRRRLVFKAMKHVFARDGVADLLNIRYELEERGELEKAGGLVYLGSLVDAYKPDPNTEILCTIVSFHK